MLQLFALLLIGFFKVAARAFQQKNVMNDKYVSIIPVSYLMGIFEVAFAGLSVTKIIADGWLQILPIAFAYGTGGWIGCWFAIWLHKKVHK